MGQELLANVNVSRQPVITMSTKTSGQKNENTLRYPEAIQQFDTAKKPGTYRGTRSSPAICTSEKTKNKLRDAEAIPQFVNYKQLITNLVDFWKN
jgi:hypothetical protein